MDKLITVYHGSKQIVEVPTFGLGRKNNDFGLGFYCTESIDLAKEWAVSSLSDGFASRYTLDTEYLNILNLNSPDYTILNWMAVLVAHRLFSIKSLQSDPVLRSARSRCMSSEIRTSTKQVLTPSIASQKFSVVASTCCFVAALSCLIACSVASLSARTCLSVSVS